MNDLIELLVKASLLQNSRTREIAELFSKFKSATDADSILRYRSVCCNLLQMIETNQIPLPSEAEKQQQIAKYLSEISRCDAEMQHLQAKVMLEALLAQMTSR